MFTFICSNSPIVNTPNCYSTVDAKHYQSTMLSSTAQVDRHSPGLCQPPVATFTTRRLIITETAKTAVRSITPEVAEAHTLPAEIGVDHVTEQLPVEVQAAQPRCHTAQDVLTRYTLHICEFWLGSHWPIRAIRATSFLRIRVGLELQTNFVTNSDPKWTHPLYSKPQLSWTNFACPLLFIKFKINLQTS